jgi:predicted GIY-YIG superfamily endonuclease
MQEAPGMKPEPKTTSYIYTLLDENNRIFYVGQSVNPASRLEQHIDESVHGTSKKCRFIRDMMKRGLFPTTVTVDKTTFDKIDALESEWIAKLDCTLHDDGYIINLQNGNNGSQGNDLTDAEVTDQVQTFKKVKAGKKHPGYDPDTPQALAARQAIRDRMADNNKRAAECQAAVEAAERLYESNRAEFERQRAIAAERRAQEKVDLDSIKTVCSV